MIDNNTIAKIIQDGWHIKFMDTSEFTCDLYETAVLSALPRMSDSESILHYIPKQFLTLELCELAIERDGCAIRDIPRDLLTYDLCELAVKKKGTELIGIPVKFQKKALIKLAIEEDGAALVALSKNQITEELCWIAMKTAPHLFCYVPDNYKSLEMYVYAQRRCPTVLPGDLQEFREKAR